MSQDQSSSADRISQAIASFGGATVLVVGDVILDRFINGVIERISPEAPIPVLHGRSESSAIGGAGNVVSNIVSLGGRAVPVSVVGNDRAGRDVVAMLEKLGVDTSGILVRRDRMTSTKSRYSAMTQQVLRFDEEEIRPLAPDERAELLTRFRSDLGKADIVILSDYGKGVLLDGVAAELIGLCRGAGKPVLVDPKGRDYSVYRNATAVSPNRKELGEAVGRMVFSDDEVTDAARRLIAANGFDFVLATRSEKGMSVIGSGDARHIATQAREVFDVSGAGDTVIASFALGLATGLDRTLAATLANAAAGVVVGKRGTARLTADELLGAMAGTRGPVRHADAILDRDAAVRLARTWKAEGLRVGFTNGCFDILHAGHVSLLHAARAQCDRLVVGLNSDASTRRLKGPERPVNDEHDRACVLAALSAVDAVVVFEDDTPLALIEALLPDILVKGADYKVEQVVGADVVRQSGGRVVLVDLVPGRSTTGTIGRMRGRGQGVTMTDLNAYLDRSAAALTDMIARDLSGEMDRSIACVVDALSAGKALLICGNGGSASDAIHIAGELVGRFLKERKAYNVIALPANAAVLTAWGNDYGFDTVFSRQVEAHGSAGGVLLAISTSGNSPSILAAAEQARAMDMVVIGLTGDTGGKLASLCDILLNVPATSTPIIQQAHVCLYHYLCEAVEARLSNG